MTKVVTRRIAMTGSLVSLLAYLPVSATATTISSIDSDLPPDFMRRQVVENFEGYEIYEILDEEGKPRGFSLSQPAMKQLRAVARGIDADINKGRVQYPRIQPAGVECAFAIAWFVGATVFPAVRIAKLAARLLILVRRLGIEKVARIFQGVRNIAGRTMEKEVLDLAKELSGIAALKACGIRI